MAAHQLQFLTKQEYIPNFFPCVHLYHFPMKRQFDNENFLLNPRIQFRNVQEENMETAVGLKKKPDLQIHNHYSVICCAPDIHQGDSLENSVSIHYIPKESGFTDLALSTVPRVLLIEGVLYNEQLERGEISPESHNI